MYILYKDFSLNNISRNIVNYYSSKELYQKCCILLDVEKIKKLKLYKITIFKILGIKNSSSLFIYFIFLILMTCNYFTSYFSRTSLATCSQHLSVNSSLLASTITRI